MKVITPLTDQDRFTVLVSEGTFSAIHLHLIGMQVTRLSPSESFDEIMKIIAKDDVCKLSNEVAEYLLLGCPAFPDKADQLHWKNQKMPKQPVQIIVGTENDKHRLSIWAMPSGYSFPTQRHRTEDLEYFFFTEGLSLTVDDNEGVIHRNEHDAGGTQMVLQGKSHTISYQSANPYGLGIFATFGNSLERTANSLMREELNQLTNHVAVLMPWQLEGWKFINMNELLILMPEHRHLFESRQPLFDKRSYDNGAKIMAFTRQAAQTCTSAFASEKDAFIPISEYGNDRMYYLHIPYNKEWKDVQAGVNVFVSLQNKKGDPRALQSVHAVTFAFGGPCTDISANLVTVPIRK